MENRARTGLGWRVRDEEQVAEIKSADQEAVFKATSTDCGKGKGTSFVPPSPRDDAALAAEVGCDSARSHNRLLKPSVRQADHSG